MFKYIVNIKILENSEGKKEVLNGPLTLWEFVVTFQVVREKFQTFEPEYKDEKFCLNNKFR